MFGFGPAVLLLLLGLAVVAAFRRLHEWLLLARLPQLQSAKLTRSSLIEAAMLGELVRLPKHGASSKARSVLVTSPTLAKALLSKGHVRRDVTAYKRYAAFLGRSLVLLPQGCADHSRARALLMPLFSPAATRRAHAQLVECVEHLVAKLGATAARVFGPVPLYRQLQLFTLEATAAAFLAQRIEDADAKRLIALFEEWLDTPPPLPPPPPSAPPSWPWTAGSRQQPASDVKPALPPETDPLMQVPRTCMHAHACMCVRVHAYSRAPEAEPLVQHPCTLYPVPPSRSATKPSSESLSSGRQQPACVARAQAESRQAKWNQGKWNQGACVQRAVGVQVGVQVRQRHLPVCSASCAVM